MTVGRVTKCRRCREPFAQPATGRRRRFCSDACRAAAYRRRARMRRSMAPLVGKGTGGVEFYTPPEIFDALALDFDLDPCAPPGGLPWIPAARSYSVADDGLQQPWHGRVWLNPPFGRGIIQLWLQRMVAHGDGVALTFNRPSSSWWAAAAGAADAVCFVDRRVKFRDADGNIRWDCPLEVTLFAYGNDCADALQRSGLGMVAELAA